MRTHRGSPDRRLGAVLVVLLSTLACAPSSTVRPAAGPRELTAEEQALHVLNRLAFGPRPGDVERVNSMGVDRWIALQLNPSRIPAPVTERLLAGYQSLGLTGAELADERLGEERITDERPADERMARDDSTRRKAQRRRQVYARTMRELASAKVARAVAGERQLEEVMVDFWENHFSVFAGKGPVRLFLPEYDRETIRPHALGRFRDLLGGVARSPAMLFYLDNWLSTAAPDTAAGRRRAGAARRRGLNENYARELLELHTLGADGGYTQDDVIAVARAFTGWTLQTPRQGGGFVFRPALHDRGTKTVLGVRLPAGRGIEDGEAVLDLLARHPTTARFIAGKLARRLVSDTPPPALVERAAATFLRTDGDVGETVRTIVTSPEFFSRAAYRAKVKSPFELVASALRALGAEPDPTPRTAQHVARLGQPVFGRATPDGYPETADGWLGAGAVLGRVNFGFALAAGRVPGVRVERWPVAASLAALPRGAQVDGVVAALLGGHASPATRSALLAGEAAPPDASQRPLTGLAGVVALALGSPEFQRR